MKIEMAVTEFAMAKEGLDKMEKLKALLHIDDPGKWRTVVANAKNLLEDVGAEQLELEIVVNATAVNIFDATDQEGNQVMRRLFLEAIRDLAQQDVKIVACRSSLKANAVHEDGVPDFVNIVPVAITRLVVRQMEGYAYVKP